STDPMEASEAARLQCPHCHKLAEPQQKRELNNRGVWLREGQHIDRDGNITGEARRSRIASFWMEGPAAAYQTWAQLVYKLLTAEEEYERTGSEETLKAVINTDWGLPYQSRRSLEARSSDALMARAEDVSKRTVPDGVRFIVATVDVQGGKKRRFVVQMVGYGAYGERWIIDRYNIRYSLRVNENGESQPVNPAAMPEDWDLLRTDVLDKEYPLAGDPEQFMPVLAMAVDSGGEDGVTDNAYAFWRRCKRRGVAGRVYLFKGDSTRREKLITKT
ncbi:phage terminase large subunit family protein, partial [Salmonella enterica]|nr:phage terminase large subunit family protein [Salmonella enterica]